MVKMPNINQEFTEEEFKALNIAKATIGLDWHDFIMLLTKKAKGE